MPVSLLRLLTIGVPWGPLKIWTPAGSVMSNIDAAHLIAARGRANGEVESLLMLF
jgi:hypothetical protein